VPTVVVGDLGFGGVGKTAVVAHLARTLSASQRVAIVGHGYKGRARRPTRVGTTDAHAFGDEAAALFRGLGEMCAVWVGQDRRAVCMSASQTAAVVVVDRGLGDPRLPRTVDVVVVDGQGASGVFPSGPLRTTTAALSGKEYVWTHHVAPGAERSLSGIGSRYRVRCVERPGGELEPPAWLSGRPIVTLCGVANPRSFYQALDGLGAERVDGLEVGDHKVFPARAISRLRKDALWVTTAKDRERLPAGLSVSVLHVELEIVSGQSLLRSLCERLGSV